MTIVLSLVLRFAFAALTASSVHGGWYPAFPMPDCVTFEARQVVSYRPEWREERIPCVVPSVSYRKVVTPVATWVWKLKQFDERVRTSYYTPVPREVEREAARCVMVPIMVIDPCTGCCFASCYPHWVRERVRCVEVDYRREERDVDVRVSRWVQEYQMVDQVSYVPEVTQIQTWTVRRYCVWVPCQTTVIVPVYRVQQP
ncbi:MAG: hypothetical protein HYX68_05490 [Planctomycetes bacterium]|nr:hypothetical protein [Planctomycetota bacterium]